MTLTLIYLFWPRVGGAQLTVFWGGNQAVVLHEASAEAVKEGSAVTVLTYLHGVKESQNAIAEIQARPQL